MIRRSAYRWFFFLGSALVLLALAMLAYRDSGQDPLRAARRASVAQAVAQLEGCLTCHLPAANAPIRSVLVMDHDATRLETPAVEQVTLASLQERVDAQLIGLGRRILDAPRYNAGVDATAADYLLIYDQAAHATADPTELGAILQRLAGVDEALRLIENEASPYRVSSVPSTVTARQGAVAAPQTAPAPQPVLAALIGRWPALDGASDYRALRETEPIVTLAELVDAPHRRGPPMNESYESGLWREIAV